MPRQARAQFGQDYACYAYALKERRTYEEVDRHLARYNPCGIGWDVAALHTCKTVRLDSIRLAVAGKSARLLRLERLTVNANNNEGAMWTAMFI